MIGTALGAALVLAAARQDDVGEKMTWASTVSGGIAKARRLNRMVVLFADPQGQRRLHDMALAIADAPGLDWVRAQSVFVASWRSPENEEDMERLRIGPDSAVVWLTPDGVEICRETLGTGPIRYQIAHLRAANSWELMRKPSPSAMDRLVLAIRQGKADHGVRMYRFMPGREARSSVARELGDLALANSMVHTSLAWYRRALEDASHPVDLAKAHFGLVQGHWFLRESDRVVAYGEKLIGQERLLSVPEQAFLERVRNRWVGRPPRR